MAAKAASPALPATADYGLDAPREFRRMLWRGGTLIVLGAGFYVMNRTDAPRGGANMLVALGIMGIGFLIGGYMMYRGSRFAKVQLRDAMLDGIPWRGDEKVLDVGCGRGLMAIGAARRLKTGKVTGIDPWIKEDLSGNSAESAMLNAKVEGVADRVRVENGDARRLPYQNNSYDVVLSSLALHNIREDDERDKAVVEMLRVTKPGGHIAILDVHHAGDYMRLLEKNGAEILTRSGLLFHWVAPARWFVARKKV